MNDVIRNQLNSHYRIMYYLRKEDKENYSIEDKKQCSKCHKSFPKNIEYFNRNSANKDGFHSYCRECRNEKRRNENKKSI